MKVNNVNVNSKLFLTQNFNYDGERLMFELKEILNEFHFQHTGIAFIVDDEDEAIDKAFEWYNKIYISKINKAMNELDINNFSDHEIRIFLIGNRNLLVPELATKEEIENKLGREFDEDEWYDFSIFVDRFFEEVKESFITKIVEEYKSST